MSEASAIRRIKNGSDSFFTNENGRQVEIIVALRNGREYLKTQTDGDRPDNLLSLPECKKCEDKG